jgi:ATP-dependent DNA ligase
MPEFKHMLAQEIHGFDEVEKLLSTHYVEEKYDGCRIALVFEKEKYKIINRDGRDITEQFPEFSHLKKQTNGDVILDGELICFSMKDGELVPNFQAIQKRITLQKKEDIEMRSKIYPAAIVLFDIIGIDSVPFALRVFGLTFVGARLAATGDNVSVCPRYQIENMDDFIRYWNGEVIAKKKEGVIFKDIKGKYEQGKRSWFWKKFKYKKSVDLPIERFEETLGEKGNVGFVCYSTYKGNEIKVAVNGRADRERIKNGGAKVIEVEYLQETSSGKLRQPTAKCIKG